MRKLFAASVVATILAASTALTFEVPSAQPVKGTESTDIRRAETHHPTRPVEGPEGPDVR